jgi:hypothetical protein
MMTAGNLHQKVRIHKGLGESLSATECGFMNNIIYLVGLVVVVIAVLSFFGLR